MVTRHALTSRIGCAGIQCTSYASREPLVVTFDHHFDKLDPSRSASIPAPSVSLCSIRHAVAAVMYSSRPHYAPHTIAWQRDRRDKPAWTSRFLTFEPEERAPEELYRIPDYCPPPHALSDDKMAEIRRKLTADPENPPHFLLGDDNVPLKEQQQQGSGSISYQQAHGGDGDDSTATMLMMDGDGLRLPDGHPNMDFYLMRHHHCPYLNSLAAEAASSSAVSDAAAAASAAV